MHRQHRVLVDVDVGELRAVARSKLMLSDQSARYGLAADKRLVEFPHDSILAPSCCSKLHVDRDLWINRDLWAVSARQLRRVDEKARHISCRAFSSGC